MNSRREQLILFTRYPVPGKVKTRLIPALGPEGATALHRRLTWRALRAADEACAARGVDLEIRFEGGTEAALRHWLGEKRTVRPQGDGDLGTRMARAFEESFRQGSAATVIIGSDCPELTAERLQAALDRLAEARVVLGPANDGGYYLIGLAQPVPGLFQDIAWGTETVLAQSLRALAASGLEAVLLERLSDVDRPEDLPAWRRMAAAGNAGANRLSVIIPTLNEADSIPATLASVRAEKPHEILVVDGGSTDETVKLARRAGATILHSIQNRARQMNAGAARTSGSLLLFLHGDTLPPRAYPAAVAGALQRPGVIAGAFRFRIGGRFAGKGIVEWGTNLRARWRQMPYGDQGLFLRRTTFEELGGFADLPILEDYELMRRLRRHGRVAITNCEAFTAGRRWQQFGFLRTLLTNQWMIAGYHLGRPLDQLAAQYRRSGERTRPAR